MSIRNCLAKLVVAKRISQKAMDDALALHEGLQDRLFPAMGLATSDAAGALEAARVMAQAAKERKFQAAKQVILYDRALGRIESHPKGRTAGLMGLLVRDNWEAGANTGSSLHVENHSENVTKRLLGLVDGALQPYASRHAGLTQDVESVWNIVDELFGKDTGDAAAKAAAKGWATATKYAVDRVRLGGKRLSVLEDWRLPQPWDSVRVRQFSEREFLDDLMNEVQAGNLRVMDKVDGGDAPGAAVPGIIANAYKDISLGRGGNGGAGALANEMRVFRFQNPAAYQRLMKKYGMGDGGLYNTLVGHLTAMGREISLIELLGPAYERNFERLLTVAQDDHAGIRSARKRAAAAITANTPAAAQRTFDYLSGKLSAPKSDMIAGVFGGLRNLQTASRLGSAVVAALPGDSMTATLAANYNGIPATAVLARLVRDMTVNREGAEALARQVNLTAAALVDNAIGTNRFADEIVGQGLTGRLADTVIRVQGLQAWTEGLKRAFAMEFNGLIARQAEFRFEKLDPDFAAFLKRYGFTPEQWDKMRASPQLEAEGARFFDVNAVEDQMLADRLMSAILDERRFAIIEPDARVRQATTGGLARGTWLGEGARLATQFKSFPMTFMLTHLMRATTQGTLGSRVYRTSQLVLMMTMAGAVMSQMQAVISGRDPQDMSDQRFWTQAFIRGGGGGMLGDLVYSSTTRGGEGIREYALGPAIGAATSATGDLIQALSGNKGLNGRTVAQHVKAWVPGSTLWYTKLATDRMIFDNLQAMIDPDYRASFRRYEKRLKKDFGQRFWWRPGEARPDRAPALAGGHL